MSLPQPIINNYDEEQKKRNTANLGIIFDSLLDDREIECVMNPTEPETSVQTACCDIGITLNTINLCKVIDGIISRKNLIKRNGEFVEKTNFHSIEYTRSKDDTNEIIIKNSKENTNFFNSIEIVYEISQDQKISLRIFTDQHITCTGCKNENDGQIAIEGFINEIKKYPEVFNSPEDVEKIGIHKYNIVMYNCSFSLGLKTTIINNKLNALLKKEIKKYNIFCDYDPGNHQAVKIHFMWNTNQPEKLGYCMCKKRRCKPDRKKQTGDGEGQCKKICVMIFSTGAVNILGSRNRTMAMDAYRFIVNLVRENFSKIVKRDNINALDIIKRCLGEDTTLFGKLRIKRIE